MKKVLVILLAAIIAAAAFAGCSGSSGSADTVIKGTIYTADQNDAVVQAAAVKDGKFVYVGDEAGAEQYINDDTEVIETGKGIAMPSFMEAHAHGHEGGVASLFEVNLYEGTSVKTYQDTISKFIEEHPDEGFILGSGWINGYFPDNTPTAEMLDKVSKDVPIVMVSGDHHSYWVNSKAMKLMKVDKNTKDIKGGVIERDDKGSPIGCFRENAQSLVKKVIPEYTVDEFKKGILAYQNEVKEYGITSYFEPMVNLEGKRNLITAYNQLDDEGELVLRVYGGYQVVDEDGYLNELDKAEKLKEEAKGGDFEITSIKLFADGVVEGHTAYLSEDYADAPGDRDKPLWNQKHLNKFVAKADKMGIQVHTHAIGDAAVKATIDAYEYAYTENGDTDLRHAITHLQLADDKDIKRMGKLNIVAATNPYWFCKEPGYFKEVEIPYLGKERANNEYPMKDFFDAGAIVTVASDYPVTIPSQPLHAIQTGVTRIDGRSGDKGTLLGPDQRVKVLQMMKAATYNGAYAYHAEDSYGSIEKDKSADFIVLDQNIMDVDSFKIADSNVQKTVLKGKTIFRSDK